MYSALAGACKYIIGRREWTSKKKEEIPWKNGEMDKEQEERNDIKEKKKMIGLIKTAIICATIVACLWIFMRSSNDKKDNE